MKPLLIKVPLDSPTYLGLTFDNHFSSHELQEMRKAFEVMAKRHCLFPNLSFICRFMQLYLLDHARFPAYLATPAALQTATILMKALPAMPFINTQLSATCLLSQSEFIRFTVKGHESAGLWVRNECMGQSQFVQKHYTFNVDLGADYTGEKLLYGDSLASDVQHVIKQILILF